MLDIYVVDVALGEFIFQKGRQIHESVTHEYLIRARVIETSDCIFDNTNTSFSERHLSPLFGRVCI